MFRILCLFECVQIECQLMLLAGFPLARVNQIL